MNIFLTKLISTFFYIGYLPIMPGTWGSIAGIEIYFLVKESLPIYGFCTACFILLSLLVSDEAQRLFRKKDSPHIVIDEISGVLVSLLFLPYDIRLVIIAFSLFRIIDILKPYPLDKLHSQVSSIGVVGDDIMAGIYTNIVLQTAVRLTALISS